MRATNSMHARNPGQVLVCSIVLQQLLQGFHTPIPGNDCSWPGNKFPDSDSLCACMAGHETRYFGRMIVFLNQKKYIIGKDVRSHFLAE